MASSINGSESVVVHLPTAPHHLHASASERTLVSLPEKHKALRRAHSTGSYRHQKRKLHPSDDPTHWQSNPIFKILVSGIGFMCDAYDLFIMSLILVLLSFEYNESSADKSLIATAVLVGSVLGQLMFGVIADYLGRKKSFVATLSLVITGALFSAFSFQTNSFPIFYCLAIARLILGVGIGGEYPLSATVSSEAATEPKGRGQRIATVFSMQAIGAVLSPAVVSLTLTATNQVWIVWRFCLGFGSIPAMCLIYFRATMKESESFIKSHGAEMSLKDANQHKWRDLKLYKWKLLGTAGSWMIFDIVFYANGLFSSTILEKFYDKPATDAPDAQIHSYLLNITLSTLYISLISLPGYIVATLLIDRIGRRKLQLAGFCGMVITYIICGAAMNTLLQNLGLFYFLYGLSFFCAQGANVTTYVIPAELFPTTIRATCHGISAAVGKVGAVIGGALMPAILSQLDLSYVMYVSAGISAVGIVWTYFFTWETMNQPLPQSAKHIEKYPRPQHEIDAIRSRIATESAAIQREEQEWMGEDVAGEHSVTEYNNNGKGGEDDSPNQDHGLLIAPLSSADNTQHMRYSIEMTSHDVPIVVDTRHTRALIPESIRSGSPEIIFTTIDPVPASEASSDAIVTVCFHESVYQ